MVCYLEPGCTPGNTGQGFTEGHTLVSLGNPTSLSEAKGVSHKKVSPSRKTKMVKKNCRRINLVVGDDLKIEEVLT